MVSLDDFVRNSTRGPMGNSKRVADMTKILKLISLGFGGLVKRLLEPCSRNRFPCSSGGWQEVYIHAFIDIHIYIYVYIYVYMNI